MPKDINYKESILIAPNIYWVGMYLEKDPFQCHPYFIKNGDESILIDPGSMLEFDETIRKVSSICDLSCIKYIVLHHQDPDLCAAVPEIEKLVKRDDMLVVTHSRMSVLIKHYLIKSSYYEIDKHNNQLITSNGFRLDFHTTPYCHSPGAFVTYEPKSKTLFSGDIFGGMEESWDFYADETYFDKAKQFHQEYMPSKDIFNYTLKKIQNLDIDLIAPQHGSIIEKKYIHNLIEDMKNLDCGLYIEDKYNAELIDTIKELKEKDKLIFEQSKRAEIGEMLGNIAHQWRQPLAIVNTILAILKEKNEITTLSKDEISDKIQKIEKRIVYLSDTIEDFMNYYRPDKEKTVFSIDEAINKALEISNFIPNKKTMDISTDKSLKTYGFMNEYMQVIVCILSNIYDVKIERSLENLHINIELKRETDCAVLSIADNAGGIDSSIISKIFDPYFTTKHQSKGTGLGLHMTYNLIVNGMGGKIEVSNTIFEYENNKYKGAMFTITLPL